jgi:ubiquinone/menaquinone biosynthesis C-methylase UbiE
MQDSVSNTIDVQDLEQKVKSMYRDVALNPDGRYHFEMGRGLAEKLGYDPDELDMIPQSAIESFAGVGYFFDLANITRGETIADLGSGSGMDLFLAAQKTGSAGKAIGIDMTDEQLQKAEGLKLKHGLDNVSLIKSYIESLPLSDNSCDVVISNGVINLSHDKAKVFTEASRILKQGGRLAIADIVTEVQLPEKIVCNTNLWASCIGGASQIDTYKTAIINAGFEIRKIKHNDKYGFISKSAKGATDDYGVKSISLLAVKMPL